MNAEEFMIKLDALKADSGDCLQLHDASGTLNVPVRIRREGYRGGSYLVMEAGRAFTIVFDYAEPRANGDAAVLKNRTTSMEIESLVGILDLRDLVVV